MKYSKIPLIFAKAVEQSKPSIHANLSTAIDNAHSHTHTHTPAAQH